MESVTELEGGRALVIDGSWAGEPVRLINVYAPSDVELLAEYIRKNPNIRGIQTPGDAKKEVKCSLYMDDVTLFCTDGKSVQSLLEACKDFRKASGAKFNVDKSQVKLFGRWDLCNEPLPFPVEAGLVKILGIWFWGLGAAAKSLNERLAKVKQKLGFWSLRHLSIEGKALVLRNDARPVLQYVTQAWPLLANIARAVNSMVFHFVWHSKMDRVKRTVMHKEHRKGGKAVPDIPTILRAFFVCGCVRITLTNENKDHSAYKVFRFFLLPVWRRLGWDKWENATMFNWDLPWYYKEIEKFVVEFGLNCHTKPMEAQDNPQTNQVQGHHRTSERPATCYSNKGVGKCILSIPNQQTQRHCMDGRERGTASPVIHAQQGPVPTQRMPKGMHCRGNYIPSVLGLPFCPETAGSLKTRNGSPHPIPKHHSPLCAVWAVSKDTLSGGHPRMLENSLLRKGHPLVCQDPTGDQRGGGEQGSVPPNGTQPAERLHR
ncbi:hypothetical protein NDU88_007959 [Pleurodeles waltl]|uniref:Reverse transcriptase domain-containing protein n=1 Tax=Pleurodeles waltl TaxID=8319 RepID=A0AAV7STZ0_PLEWA|nr:hypothetical protein NDU88_007959 [Pleurodeles waltl]